MLEEVEEGCALLEGVEEGWACLRAWRKVGGYLGRSVEH